MTQTKTPNKDTEDFDAMDIFAAARWLESLGNSTARACSAEIIEWQCTTWGSGRGHGTWEEIALFTVVAEALKFQTCRNYDARDELVVMVPFRSFPDTARLIERLGPDSGAWPWFSEEDHDRQVEIAAEFFCMSTTALEDDYLLEAIGLE